jgi:hypothetical protein
MEDIEVDDDRFMSFCVKFKSPSELSCEHENPNLIHPGSSAATALLGSVQ